MVDILILDDDAPTRAFLRTVATSVGYTVLEADNGDDGLLMAVRSAPRLILADLYMPGMDGLSFARRLQAMPFARPPRLLLMSASPPPAPLDVGQRGMLSKPFDVDALLETLAALLPPAAATPALAR